VLGEVVALLYTHGSTLGAEHVHKRPLERMVEECEYDIEALVGDNEMLGFVHDIDPDVHQA